MDADRTYHRVNSPALLGATFREARARRGLTQAQVAEQLGMSERYVVELEQGKPSIQTDRTFALLRLLDIDIQTGLRG